MSPVVHTFFNKRAQMKRGDKKVRKNKKTCAIIESDN